MKETNQCYTYFSICGDFNPDTITDILQLEPSKRRDRNELRKDGHPFGFSLWEYGRVNEYNINNEDQLLTTIKDLIPKTDILKEIHEKYDVTLYLEIVPILYPDEITPSFTLGKEIIDFCHITGTCIDMDLYINEKDKI
ncbi:MULTISPECIES: DUF4279 domain-containing protein [unclassified Breznakia]|uniref:DUF4279 domain-containing protein n=1 Tax=unclassified Breznakia TaxID=2623764 RepID=UPI0024756B1A|nr:MULTISPECIES: DUF4279 domain-containing protein [unclassified Breznakia]MDH6366491.1 hypothetical protein [Breznakia sp. PH1-1]MDH6403584.1 hypothetical protein [Breznakia sp. PF1-11]MDH6411293.1 hypothetical protein [Breznakia sp. PFB1-11]MDH6413731.1 hypothetical protein [Breznakia sp. PFB1-14]MDH6415838.1 hypothetical protein [Breznakia sp. PFB1-4]